MMFENLRREVRHEENRENNHVCRCIYLCDRSLRTRFRGVIYSRVLLIIMIGILTALAGYGLICLDDFIPDIKKSHPLMLCRAGAIYKEFK